MIKSKFDKLLFSLIICLGPLSITQWNKPILGLILVLSCLLLFSMSISNRGVVLSKLQLVFTIMYFGTFALGFFTLLISSLNPFGMLVDTNTFGRVFTVSVLASMSFACFAYMNSLNDVKFIALKKLFFVPGVVFILFGFYQVYCNVTGVSFFIETRDWMHGVPAHIRNVFPKRVTSIAEEPSFLAPVLVEFLILSFFLITRRWLKYLFIVVTMALLLMTFSGGAYANVFFIFTVAIIIMLFKSPFGKLHILVLASTAVIMFVTITYAEILIEFVFNKFMNEASGGSDRGQFMKSLIELILNTDTFSLIFGHGLTSLSYLGDFGMKSEDMLFRISNNMFVDIAWESGLVGALMMVTIYSILLIKSMRIQIRNNATLSLSLMLVIQSLITSFYRSEYISTHMIWVVLIIFWALRYERINSEQNLNLQRVS